MIAATVNSRLMFNIYGSCVTSARSPCSIFWTVSHKNSQQHQAQQKQGREERRQKEIEFALQNKRERQMKNQETPEAAVHEDAIEVVEIE